MVTFEGTLSDMDVKLMNLAWWYVMDKMCGESTMVLM